MSLKAFNISCKKAGSGYKLQLGDGSRAKQKEQMAMSKENTEEATYKWGYNSCMG